MPKMSGENRYLVTAALPYANGRLHVGHVAGAYLPADIYVRYLRARGRDVRFICGSDDNGVPNILAAVKEEIQPEELVSKYNALQAKDFKGLGIEFDIYGGTHIADFADLHTRFSQKFFRKIHEKGYLTKRKTSQLYDTEAEQFLPDRYVTGICHHCQSPGALGDQCEHCGRLIDPLLLGEPKSVITGSTPEVRETIHWHLKLQEFETPLAKWLDGHPEWRPVVLNFCRGLLREGLPERAMTRDISWGVPVPLDDPDAAGKVLYVWFDAPIGYVTFTAEALRREGGRHDDYQKWWKDPDCKIVHFIGEDNIMFHAVIWPAMMMAEGTFQLPDKVVANAFLNIKFPGKEEEKFSKSRGAAIWIGEYLETFDADPLRYYLTAIAPEQQRTVFEVEDFITRNNNELLAALGNFVNRTLTFTHRYFDGQVPDSGEREPIDQEQMDACRASVERVTDDLEACRFKSGLGGVMALARAGNVYFDATAPFRTRKTDPAACGRAINVSLQTVKTLTTVMAPFLPFTAKKCVALLGLDDSALNWNSALSELPPGAELNPPEILFQKLDADFLGETSR
jgi:methionyl-tRNA synthetase